MSPDSRPAVSAEQAAALLALVSDLNRCQCDRATAFRRLRELQEAIPDGRLDLVWDLENVGTQVTYSLLLSIGEQVYSVCSSAAGAVPWPLRGAVQPDADVLLRVDGHAMTVAQAIRLLDFVWDDAALSARIINAGLLARELDRTPIAVSEGEADDAMRRFLLARGASDAAAEEAWLKSNGLSRERMRGIVGDALAMRKLERRLVDAEFNVELREHRNHYLGMRVAQLRVPPGLVAKVETLLNGGPIPDLSEVGRLMAWEWGGEGLARIEFVELLRHELGEESRHVFGRSVGDRCLVRMGSGETRLIEVLGHEGAVSEAALERRIVSRLASEWCQARRQTARIEWYWGPASMVDCRA